MPVRLMDKQRRVIDTRKPSYAVFRRRRRIALLVLVLLALLIVSSFGLYLFSGTSEETSEEQPEQAETPAVEEVPEEPTTEEEAATEEEEGWPALPAPNDPTLYLTVPKLGLYDHTVRNDASEPALDLGAIKLPETGFPWQKGDTNTYIACHRLGWPGNESFQQCLNLPSMRQGDEIFLRDTSNRVYRYRVSEIYNVWPLDTWVTRPVAGEDVVSLQTCTETVGDIFTMGPNWLARYVVQAKRVA